jgi:hypothetical protein
LPNHDYGVLHHTGIGTLHVEALRITDSHGGYSALPHPCIQSAGTVDLNRSTVTMCSVGGIFANGFISRDSTISYNSGGGLFTQSGNVSIDDSTISNNEDYYGCAGFVLGRRNTATTATARISTRRFPATCHSVATAAPAASMRP